VRLEDEIAPVIFLRETHVVRLEDEIAPVIFLRETHVVRLEDEITIANSRRQLITKRIDFAVPGL
jgi:hypothetical protein